jgi:hypothetical protein
MNTLLFCTGYSPDLETWNKKYGIWVYSIKTGKVYYEHLLIIDDASPVIPDWKDVAIVKQGPLPTICSNKPTIYTFDKRLGRQSISCYPGWFRSFMYSATYAETYGFNKIVHIEADSFVISDRMSKYINSLTEGWTTFWCPKYNFPEPCIQVIAGDSLKEFFKWNNKKIPYLGNYHNKLAENYLPFTNIVKDFYGDRWGESDTEPPKEADYATQMKNLSHCWWLTKQ